VTGRSWRTAVERLKPAPAIEYVISSNGACIYQQSKNAIIWENTIDLDLLPKLLAQFSAVFPGASYGWESATGWGFEEAYLALVEGENIDEPGAIAGPLGTQELYKLYIKSPDHTTDQMLAALPAAISNIAAVSTSGAPFLEATAFSADKGKTLAYLTEQLSIPVENCIAFGDNLNDLPMLEWAGTGVAMGNAAATVKTIANDVTLGFDADGVAHYIEQLLAKN